jgi:NDP-sugar pyrophosphorylase family protein
MAILSREALKFFPGDRKIGFVEILLKIIKSKAGSVAGYIATGMTDRILWSDIGSPENYLDLHKRILTKQALFDPEIAPPGMPLHVGPNTVIASDTSWKGFLEVGAGARIGQNCELENCVVLPGTIVQSGANFKNYILFPEGQIHVKGL